MEPGINVAFEESRTKEVRAVVTESSMTELDQIVHPLSEEKFFECYLNKEFRYIPGERSRFCSLLPWSILNRILHEHRLDYPRVRLIRNGETLPPVSFIEYLTDRRGSRYSRVHPERLAKELAKGAMLHFSAIDEAHEPLSRVADSLSRRLKAKITINICAGIRDSRGFSTHWDGHDVLVMQIHGRKYWRVYGMTETNPVRFGMGMDAAPQTERPKQSTWEGMIDEGDVLYLPRGCWHSAEGTDSPTLHLTVGIINPTGLDFFRWLTNELIKNSTFRMDLPQLRSPNVQQQHVAVLRDALNAVFTSESMECFLNTTHDKQTSPSSYPNLPLVEPQTPNLIDPHEHITNADRG